MNASLASPLVVFSDDWGEHPSSCQHLVKALLGRRRTLWVNSVGMRLPRINLRDFEKALRKLSKMAAGGKAPSRPDGGPTVLQPFMLPIPASRAAERFNSVSAARAIRRWLAEAGEPEPVVLTTVPNAIGAIERLRCETVVYYCVDDFAQWPGLDGKRVAEMERRLVARADVVLATSDALYARLQRTARRVVFFPHGVDLEHFGTPSAVPPPASIAAIPAPRAGYFGLIDERLDRDLLVALARALPDWNLVLAGPVAVDLARLVELPNVHTVGPVPYQDLPALAHALDALLIPYRVDAFTATISPLKLNEYLLTGVPVVSSALPEAVKWAAQVRIATTPAEWAAAVQEARGAKREVRRAAAVEALAGASWVAKAARLEGIFMQPRARLHSAAS